MGGSDRCKVTGSKVPGRRTAEAEVAGKKVTGGKVNRMTEDRGGRVPRDAGRTVGGTTDVARPLRLSAAQPHSRR